MRAPHVISESVSVLPWLPSSHWEISEQRSCGNGQDPIICTRGTLGKPNEWATFANDCPGGLRSSRLDDFISWCLTHKSELFIVKPNRDHMTLKIWSDQAVWARYWADDVSQHSSVTVHFSLAKSALCKSYHGRAHLFQNPAPLPPTSVNFFFKMWVNKHN